MPGPYNQPTYFHRVIGITTLWLLLTCTILSSQCPNLIWSDEFDGNSLDETKWSYVIGDGCDEGLCGFGNNELQYYRAENTTVSDGFLTITAQREDFGEKEYTSSRLHTLGKADFTYGRMEARIKLPTGQGIWPAFWMLPSDEVYGGWPQSGELDIMEMVGHEPSTVHGTLHYGQPWPNNSSTGASYSLNYVEFHEEFHEFAIEWEPGEIRWYVDGYLYSTKTPDDLEPENWPFDQDFYFLLNLAVGGDWPGSPDETTQFPQEMVVDYVRVYDGNQPALVGNRNPVYDYGEDTTSYSVLHAPEDAEFAWTLSGFGTITGGQATSSVDVNLRVWGGELSVAVTSSCGTDTLSTQIVINPAYAPDFILENFDEEALIDYEFSTGTFTDNVPNPGTDDINDSPLSGKYERNSSEQYDVLMYTTNALEDADEFFYFKKFYIDIFTDAPTGTQILLQLEDSGTALPENYPTGRHSRFEAYTSQQNTWERLEFKLLDEPDPNIDGEDVDKLILLFASNSNDGSTWHFDNFEVYSEVMMPGVKSPPVLVDHFTLYPNPATDTVFIEYSGESTLQHLQLIDLSGRVIWQKEINLLKSAREPIEIGSLAPGSYFVMGVDDEGAVGLKSLNVAAN